MMNKLDENIAMIHRHRMEAHAMRSWHQKFANKVTVFLGNITNLYLHFIVYSVWFFYLTSELHGPPKQSIQALGLVGSVASLEAVFFTVFILVNQRHMQSIETNNSDLHLQTSLIMEHEITRLIHLTDAIIKFHGIVIESKVSDLAEIKQEIKPEDILEKIKKNEEDS